MDDDINFANFNIQELNVLLKHLKLGISHIKKYLTDENVLKLFAAGKLTEEQSGKIKSDQKEKQGNFILTINVIFTGFLGAWLGVAGFLKIGVKESNVLFVVTVLVAVVGSIYFGYKNFKKTEKRAHDAGNKQKILNLQLKIIRIIKNKRQNHIAKLIDYLNDVLRKLNTVDQTIVTHDFSSKNDFFNWLKQLDEYIQLELKKISDADLRHVFSKQMDILLSNLKEDLDKNVGLIETQYKLEDKTADEGKNKESMTPRFVLEEQGQKSSISALIDPTIYIPRLEIKEKSWIEDNFYSIVSGLIPTMLGGFGSLFIYFMGLPDIAKQAGIMALNPLLEDPVVKVVALVIIILITLYFIYSFLYTNRKSFQRDQELNKTQKKINNEEADLLEIRAKMNVLIKMKRHVKNILSLFNVVRGVNTAIDGVRGQKCSSL